CISLNLVGALARRYPGEVLLLDLDFPYSHSALLAGLVPTACLARMSSVPQGSFEEVLLSAVLYHPKGPMILPGALRPEEADEITPELITKAISVLRKSFSYIVVDLGVTITDSTLALFDLTQHVVVVTAPELSAVKSAADAIDILVQLGTPHDRLSVVLNNRSFKPAVTKSAVERSLKRDIDVQIQFDGSRPEQAAVDGVDVGEAIEEITNRLPMESMPVQRLVFAFKRSGTADRVVERLAAKSPQQRARSARVVGALQLTEAVSWLAALLGSRDRAVSDAAARALGKIGGARSATALVLAIQRRGLNRR